MKILFHPIGSTFQHGDVTLKVVEIKNPSVCIGCWYAHRNRDGVRNYAGSCYLHGHACTSGNRRDHKQVVFTQVTDV